MREQVLKEWTNCREKFNTKIATLNTKIDELTKQNEKYYANLYKQGSKLSIAKQELSKIKEFINPLFDPNNKPFILLKKRIPEDDGLRIFLGNYYQFSLTATWKAKDRELVITSIKNGQTIEHTLETLTSGNPYYLGKLALTENESVVK